MKKIIFILSLLMLCGCANNATNQYDWDYLITADSYYTYSDATYRSETVIDVSKHQGTIDWQEVSAAGIDNAIVRAIYRGYSEGKLYQDENAITNIKGALDNGIAVGLYDFSQAITTQEAIDEADMIIQIASSYDVTLPIVFDMEVLDSSYRTATLSASEKTTIANAFINEISLAGYTPMVYGSTSWFKDEINISDLSDCQIWLADYDGYPKVDFDFTMWQYSNSATIDGISNDVDLSIWFIEK